MLNPGLTPQGRGCARPLTALRKRRATSLAGDGGVRDHRDAAAEPARQARGDQGAMPNLRQSFRAVLSGATGLLLLFMTACTGAGSSSPTAPTVSSEILTGAYLFLASVSATSVLPGSPATFVGCSNSGVIGLSLSSFVTLSRQGNTWIARSTTSADGDLEIRLSESAGVFGQVQLTGSARGTAVDRRSAQTLGLPSLQLSVANGPGAVLSGRVLPSPAADLIGNAMGTFAVASSIGHGTCERADWRIRKPEPCEAALSCS